MREVVDVKGRDDFVADDALVDDDDDDGLTVLLLLLLPLLGSVVVFLSVPLDGVARAAVVAVAVAAVFDGGGGGGDILLSLSTLSLPFFPLCFRLCNGSVDGSSRKETSKSWIFRITVHLVKDVTELAHRSISVCLLVT